MTSLVILLLSSGVTARLSAEPPSAKGMALDWKLIGLQYLQGGGTGRLVGADTAERLHGPRLVAVAP
jgi:hypothetical protein